jgi:hypothetical protein
MDIQKEYAGLLEAFNSVYTKPEQEILSEETLEEKKIATGTGKKVMPSAKERSALAKKARAGKDIGKPGKGFEKVAAKAAKQYGSKEAGERVAAAAMFKAQAKEEVETDLFDYILEHLVTEGYADTNQAALAIMANMSEDWKQSIVEGGFNSSGRYDVGGGRTVGPVAGAVRSLFSGNLPKGQTYVPPTRQTGPNRPPAVPASKDDSGKLTDFGAGGGKAKLKTGMSVGQVERQGRMNKGDYSG